MSYRISLRSDAKGNVTGAVIRGIHEGREGMLNVVSVSQTHIVLHRQGYSENPGSRYSMLMSYYTPETTVYEIEERISKHTFHCEAVTSWSTGRGKNREVPKLPKMERGMMYVGEAHV